jgi:hypothetical protein
MESLSISLGFSHLLSHFQDLLASVKDPRKPSNNTSYALKDVVLSAFSLFFMQSASFLEYQRQVQSQQGQDNVQTLFEIASIPSNNQIGNILDRLNPVVLYPLFAIVYQLLSANGWLKAYEVLGKQLLVSLDGTNYFSSEAVHCRCCSTREHQDGRISYFHQAILPVIVAPGHAEVISLAPEFIYPQDGHHKQDCEQQAAKRWIKAHTELFKGQPITLLGDDLYSHQPLCEACIEAHFNFIFVCLPDSHSSLYEWLEYLEANAEVKTLNQRQWNGQEWLIYDYRYVNRIPLRDQQPALMVNWFELTVSREADAQRLYHNAFITRHLLSDAILPDIAQAARARWKSENENNNVLKTKGYHLEHNFGHGKQYLSSFMLTLNLLAFLWHTVLQLVDQSYQLIRQRIVKRATFFEHIRSLTQYLVFESWQSLINFMINQSEPLPPRRERRRHNSS